MSPDRPTPSLLAYCPTAAEWIRHANRNRTRSWTDQRRRMIASRASKAARDLAADLTVAYGPATPAILARLERRTREARDLAYRVDDRFRGMARKGGPVWYFADDEEIRLPAGAPPNGDTKQVDAKSVELLFAIIVSSRDRRSGELVSVYAQAAFLYAVVRAAKTHLITTGVGREAA